MIQIVNKNGNSLTDGTIQIQNQVYPEGIEITGEVPSGTINGINGTFNLAHIPFDGFGLYLNGLKLYRGVDYTLSGLTITMTTIPYPGDILQADYNY